MTPTIRTIATATLRATFPRTPAAVIDRCLDEIAAAGVAAEVAEATGTTTADTIPEPAAEPAGDGLPPLDTGLEVVTVERFFDKTWPDSGRVRTLLLKRVDGTELKTKFGEERAATWKAACSALGCQPEDGWRDIQGRQAVAEIVDWTAKDGTTMPIVRRWVARPGSPRAVEKAAEAQAKAERAAKRSPNAVEHPTADDLPF
jgi:hypothetical protein